MNLNSTSKTIFRLLKGEGVPTKRLVHDEQLFARFQAASVDSGFVPSDYWKGYTELILQQIRCDGLAGFGRNAELTRGFGDARTYPPYWGVRRRLKIPLLYRPVEILLAHIRQNRSQKHIYGCAEKLITEKDFVRNLVEELDPIQESLGINRIVSIGKMSIPFRYLQSILYIELLKQVLIRNLPGVTLNETLAGNTLDIGGGYGVVSDGFNVFKRSNKIGLGTTDYIIDQFPVAYIANQYLAHRYPGSIANPVLSDSAGITRGFGGAGNYVRVIQSSSLDNVAGLNIKYFFNSNSFQEMNQCQVSSYIEFIKRNSSERSFIGCFFYHGKKSDNKIDPVISLLKNNFTLVGLSELKDVCHGIIPGIYYLFSVR